MWNKNTKKPATSDSTHDPINPNLGLATKYEERSSEKQPCHVFMFMLEYCEEKV